MSLSLLVAGTLALSAVQHQHQHEEPQAPPMQHEQSGPGLTEEAAVAMALKMNPALLAGMAKLGIAEADLQQAGLYQNPELEVVINYPDAGREWDAELAFHLSDLWRVPIQKHAARAELDRTSMLVLREMQETAAQVKAAYASAQAHAQIVTLAHEIHMARQEYRDEVYRRFDYGFASDLDKAAADADLAEAIAMAAEAEALLASARARLGSAMGHELAEDAMLATPLALPHHLPALADLREQAQSRRAEVLAARSGVDVSEAMLAEARSSVWDSLTLGPTFRRESGGEDVWGLKLQMELPVFDQGQAARRRAQAELAKSRLDVNAVMNLVSLEVAERHAEASASLKREAALRSQVVPAREKALEYARTQWMKMVLNRITYLEAQDKLFAARKEAIAAALEARLRVIDLELAAVGSPEANP